MPRSADDPAVHADGARQRIAYGEALSQFGELWVPPPRDEPGPRPVVVVIHGGFWRNRYGLSLMDPLAADLAERGYAAWNLEYRRLGDDGGGWPGTFDDVVAGINVLADLASEHDLDMTRVAFVGHSAGGHIALWAAGSERIAVRPLVAIGQGAVVDLVGVHDAGLSDGVVATFLGGSPADVPERYDAARVRFDAGARLVSIVGTLDDNVAPRFSTAPEQPDAIEMVEIEGADHFDLIDAQHDAWAAVVDVLERELG